MSSSSNITIVTIQSINAALTEAEHAHRQKMLGLVDEGMVEPTWDGKRYHAPCNHYTFDGVDYAAGEFLHDPFDRKGSVKSEKRFGPVKKSDAIEFADMINEHNGQCSFGKEFDGQCYVYVSGYSSLLNRLEKIIPASGKVLVEANTGFETGKTWSTTLGKIKQHYFEYDTFTVEMSEELERKVLNWYLDNNPKKKSVKVTVGYCYRSCLIVSDKTNEELQRAELIKKLQAHQAAIDSLNSQLSTTN